MGQRLDVQVELVAVAGADALAGAVVSDIRTTVAGVDRIAYQDLAAAYDWLVPEELLTPEGNAAMFDAPLATLEPGARVLDCACGTGMLAVGLARRGFQVTASDASPAMVERTRALAEQHGVDIDVERRAWDELAEPPERTPFDAVLCVGNSLTHAEGTAARRRRSRR